MTDELSRIQPLVPRSVSDLEVFATNVYKAGQAKSAYEAFYVIQYGLELGLPPAKSIQSLHLIKGKVTMSADLMVALCLRSPDCDYIEVAESTADHCTYRAKRRGRPEQTFTFTMADAKRAGLTGDNWRKYPHAMLKARAGSHLARQVFPDVVMGLYDPDEIRNVGDAEVVEPVVEPAEPEQTPIEQLEQIAGPHFVEFLEATEVAMGKAPPKKTIVALVNKLTPMTATQRGEWMQSQIDKHLGGVVESEPLPTPAVQDAEFEPVEGDDEWAGWDRAEGGEQ